jgi:hypothetical protein
MKTTAPVDMTAYVTETVAHLHDESRKRTADLAKAKRAVAKFVERGEPFTYEVHLHNLWADHGGKHTVTTTRGSLAEAIENAEAEFMKVNNRGDVQARYTILILLSTTNVLVDGSVYASMRQKYKDEDA